MHSLSTNDSLALVLIGKTTEFTGRRDLYAVKLSGVTQIRMGSFLSSFLVPI